MTIDAAGLDLLFREARTHNKWHEDAVSDETLHELYDLLKQGPTSANCSPARFLFLRTKEAKERLAPALSSGNLAKTMAAPVTVIVAYDLEFFSDHPDETASAQMTKIFANSTELATATAFRNGTLQGAYLVIAARALGLTVGPMSGFDANAVNREFFPHGRYQANFLANIGYADETQPRPRGPRFEFDDVAEVL